MTTPRFIRPGRTWLVTRRTTRRTFLLRPDADQTTQDIYWYTTAVLAAKFGIEIHAVQVLSTHLHEVLTDTRGQLPAFLRERNRALANALKRHRNWPEEVFQRAPASCVEIYGVNALCREIAYTIANCVEAGLVDEPKHWPGASVVTSDIGRRIVDVARPRIYFRTKNQRWPARARLAITMPSELSKTYGARARRVLRRTVDRALYHARRVARTTGRLATTSVDALQRMPISRRSTEREPSGTRNPQFATAGDRELTRLAVRERTIFYEAHTIAVRAAKTRDHAVLFPHGTWRWMQELHFPTSKSAAPS